MVSPVKPSTTHGESGTFRWKLNMVTINDKHEYYNGTERIPSVTQIICEILGTQWEAEEWYLQRGKAIHKCAELIAAGKKFTFDDRLSGYVTAIKKFFCDVRPELISGGGEQLVFSQLFNFAGTIDLPCKIGGKKVIVDYKHSLDLEKLKLQCGGYSQGCYDQYGIRINHGCGIKIMENGTYSMTEIFTIEKPRLEFLALRSVYGIKERMKLLKHQQREPE